MSTKGVINVHFVLFFSTTLALKLQHIVKGNVGLAYFPCSLRRRLNLTRSPLEFTAASLAAHRATEARN